METFLGSLVASRNHPISRAPVGWRTKEPSSEEDVRHATGDQP